MTYNNQELFCLKYNEMEKNLSSSFRKLREEKVLFDVTLAVESTKFQAHKVILSACSKFFKEIFQDNSHPHPYIYLKGVETVDLEKMLDFVYEGEAKVEKDRLDSFLQCAQDLQIMGLVNEVDLSFRLSDIEKHHQQQQQQQQMVTPFKKKRKLTVPQHLVKFPGKKTKESSITPTNHPIVRIEDQDDIVADYEEEEDKNGVFLCTDKEDQFSDSKMYEIPERIKTQANRSWVWNYMGFLGGEVNRVTCKICEKSLAYHNSTSSMASHLRRYHYQETAHVANLSGSGPKIIDAVGCSYQSYNITDTTEDASSASLQPDIAMFQDQDEEEEEDEVEEVMADSKAGVSSTF